MARRILRARPRFRLKLELVPETLWGVNLRCQHALGKNRWDKLRRKIEPKRCAFCESTERLHGHEVWKYFDKLSVAKLARVDLVCQKCHHVNHWGRTRQLVAVGHISNAGYLALRKHFRAVNKCRQEEFDRHVNRSFAVWRSRSKKQWRVDWGAFAPMIAEAVNAREAWAARDPSRDDDPSAIAPDHHMPEKCPKCGAPGVLRMIEQDTNSMSEAELADYEVGVWGVAVCRACGHEVDWGF